MAKVAFLIVGLPRDFKKTLTSFRKNVLETPENRHHSIDVYLVTYEHLFDEGVYEVLGVKRDQAPTHLMSETCYDFSPQNKSHPVYERFKIRKVVSKSQGLSRSVLTKHLIPQFYQMSLGWDLIEKSGTSYDRVIKTRFDVLYESPLLIDALFAPGQDDSLIMCDSTFAYRYKEAPNNKYTKRTLKRTFFGKINDVFVAGTQENMRKYFDLLHSLDRFDSCVKKKHLNHLRNTESYIGLYISRILGISVTHLPYEMGLWRDFKERMKM